MLYLLGLMFVDIGGGSRLPLGDLVWKNVSQIEAASTCSTRDVLFGSARWAAGCCCSLL